MLGTAGMLQAILQVMLQGAGPLFVTIKCLQSVLLLDPCSWILILRVVGRYAADTCLYCLSVEGLDNRECFGERVYTGDGGKGSSFEDILFKQTRGQASDRGINRASCAKRSGGK